MDRKKEILHSAEQVFLKYGLKKAMLSDVADSCGFKKQAIYHYFKNKEDLFHEMFSQKLDSIKAEIEAKVAQRQKLVEKLKTFMKYKYKKVIENRAFAEVLNRNYTPDSHGSFYLKKRHEMLSFDYNLLLEIIQTAKQRKEIEIKSPETFTMMILGVIYGILYQEIFTLGNCQIDDYIEESFNIFSKGINFKEK